MGKRWQLVKQNVTNSSNFSSPVEMKSFAVQHKIHFVMEELISGLGNFSILHFGRS